MSEVKSSLLRRRKSAVWLLATTLLGVAAVGCAQDVVLGEHIPLLSDSQVATSEAETSEPALASSYEGTSWEPRPMPTREHWTGGKPDGGHFFDDRDGGPRWPPRPGEQLPIEPLPLDPHPAQTDPDFPFETQDDDSTRAESSNF
jgi:hypothetical protein